MTILALDVRELIVEQVDEIPCALGPVCAAVGAVIGVLFAAGGTMARGGPVYEIAGHAVAGVLVGGAVGFFSPGGTLGSGDQRAAHLVNDPPSGRVVCALR